MSSISTQSNAGLFQKVDKKVLVAIAGFLVAVIIGATSFVSATPEGKPTKAWCAAQGYTNYGQCVKVWAQSHGYGYGGNGGGNGNGNHHGAKKHFNWGVWGAWVSFQEWWDDNRTGDAWHAWRTSFFD